MLDILRLDGFIPLDIQMSLGVIQIIGEVPTRENVCCPQCTKPMYRHGYRSIECADTPLEMQPVRIRIRKPRYRCQSCGKTVTLELPFLDEKRRATKRLVDAIRKRCLNRTFRSLAEETGLAVNTIKNIAMDLIAELEATVRYETPVIMGIDEVNLAGGYRGIITNLATNSIFDMLEYRTQAHMKPFFEKLPDREKVEWVCTDMWRPFKESFGPFLPNARLVIDKFHVVRMASEALDDERKKYQATLSQSERVKVKKSIRWLTLKRPASLSGSERKALAAVRELIPNLAEAYDTKEAFYTIYDAPDKTSAKQAFSDWESSLPDGRMEKFRKLAKTVHNHYEDIFAYWDAPYRITNAYTEGLNGLIKVANRMGRGYSYEIIRAKALYAEHARKVATGLVPVTDAPEGSSTAGRLRKVEYGPYIPTLVEMSNDDEIV